MVRCYSLIERNGEVYIFSNHKISSNIKKYFKQNDIKHLPIDKINSAAVKNPSLIRKAALKHGSQCIVVAIDGKRHGRQMRVFVKGGRELTKKELVSWSKKVQSLGAGEILLTSMDTDGVQNGFDSEMLKKVTKNVNIPVIASGGVGELNHFYLGHLTKATGLLAASVFHSGKFKITKVKKYLSSKGVPVRL